MKIDHEKIDESIKNLLSKLDPQVADRVAQKFAQEREEFAQAVKEATPSKDPAFWAKPSCRHCHGRGITAIQQNSQPIACSCTTKNYEKWLKQFRVQYNERKQGT
jgi:hypothetical protein